MGLAMRMDAMMGTAAPLMGAAERLPAWITAAPQFARLRPGARATLVAIAAACRSSGADGSLLYAEGGVELARAAGCSLRTLWRHIERLEALGFVVTIGRGGTFKGRSLPNTYGIPGSCGALSGRRRKREMRRMRRCEDGRFTPETIAPGEQAPLWAKESPGEPLPVSSGHPCQNVTPNGCKACQNGTRPERSERGKGVCKACQNGTLHDYGFKTQNHGFEARAAQHGPGEGPRQPPGGRWFRAERDDLTDDRRTLALLADARRAGFVGAGEREALKFLAAIEHARRVGDAPERLLGAIVRRGQWLYIGERDEDAARERLRRMRSAHDATAVEQAGRMVGVSPAVAAELIERCRARMGGSGRVYRRGAPREDAEEDGGWGLNASGEVSLFPCRRERMTPFSTEDLRDAMDAVGCNCGPAALAFATGVHPLLAVNAIPRFVSKRFTSPTMMSDGLRALRMGYIEASTGDRNSGLVGACASAVVSIVRIQFGGPWTEPGANPKWAYRHTHWICGWKGYEDNLPRVYDINGTPMTNGVMPAQLWVRELAPKLVAQDRNRDGTWWATHVWRLCPERDTWNDGKAHGRAADGLHLAPGSVPSSAHSAGSAVKESSGGGAC